MSYYDDDDRDEKRIPLAFNDQDFAKTSGYFRAILKRLYPKKVKYRDWGADKETYHDIKVIIFDNPYIEDDRWNSRPSDCYLDTDAMWLSKQIIQSVQSVDQLAHIISFQGSEHGDYKEIAIRMARAGFNPVNNLLGTFPEMISDNNKSRFEVALTAAIRELAEKYGISAGEGGGILSSSLDPEILKIVSDASPRVKIDFIDQQFDNLKFDTLNLDEKIKAIGMVAHAINESKDEKFRHYNWNRDKNQSREKFEARVITVMREILELAPHVIIKKSEYKEGYPDDKESPVVLSVRDQINAFGWHRGETRVYDVRMSKRYPFKIVPDEEFDAAVAENAKRKFDGKYEYALLNELYAENKGNKFTSLCRLATHHMPCVNLRKAGKVGRDFIRMAKHAFLGDEKYKDYSDNYYKLRDIQELFGNGDSDAVGHLISQMVSPDHVPVIRFSGLPKSDITIGAELPFAKPKQIETLFGIYTSSEWSSEALHLSNGDFTLCHFNPKTKISTWILIGKDKSVLKHFETKEEYDKFRKDAINEATERLCKIIAKYVTLRIKTTRALIASKTRMAKIPIAKLIELKKITGQESYHPRFSRQDYYNYSDIKNKSGWQTVRNAFRVDEYGMFMSNGRANPKLDIEKIFKDIKDREKKKDPLLTSVEFSKSAIMKHISKSNQDWLNNIDESEDEQVFKVLCDRATRIPQKFLKDFWEHKPVFRTYGSDEYIHDNEDKQEAVRCIRGFTMHQFAELLYYMNDRKSKSKKDITDLQRYVEIQNLNMYFKAGGHYELFDRVNHYFYDDESDTLKDLVINKDNKFPLADISKLPLESGYCAGLAEEMIKVYLRLAFDIAENWPTDAKTATDITKKRYYTNDKTCAIFADIAVKDTNPDNIRYALENLPEGFFGRSNSKSAAKFCNIPSLWQGDIAERFNTYSLLTHRSLFPADCILQYKKFSQLLPEILQQPVEQRFSMLVAMTRSDHRISDPILRNTVYGHLTDAMLESVGGHQDDGSDEYLEKVKALKGRMYSGNKTDYYDIMKMFAEKTRSQKKLSALLKPEKSIQEDLFSSRFVYGAIYEEIQRVFRDDGFGHLLIDFLMGPGDRSDCRKLLAELKKKRSWIRLSENELYMFHQEFTLSHLEARAFVINEIMNNITTRDESAKENWVQVFEHVISRMFPDKVRSVEDNTIIEFIHEYIKASPKESRRIKLTAMMCGFRQDSSNSNTNKWTGVRKFMENAGPAAIKLGQSMSAFPQVPFELRNELRLLKTDADRPARWELYEWLDKQENKGAFSDTDKMGNIMGSASYFVAVEKNDGSVVKILRPGAAIKANDEFIVFENALAELNTNGSLAGQLDIFESVVSNARKSSEIETDLTIGAKQNEIAAALYPKHITVGKDKYNLNVMGWNNFGAGFAQMPRASGINFDQIEDIEFKREVARAYFTLEISHILRGGIFDSDRHMGQMKIDANGRSIGLFDFGSMMMNAPAANDLYQLGNALKESFSDGKLSLGKFSDQIIAHGNPDYMLNVLRAIIALSDYSDLLSDKDIMNCVLDAAKGGVNSKLVKPLGTAGLALQFPRISKRVMSFSK